MYQHKCSSALGMGGLVSETLREVILAFDGTTAIMIFTPVMVAIAIWHEIR
jgi:hypothetical protein